MGEHPDVGPFSKNKGAPSAGQTAKSRAPMAQLSELSAATLQTKAVKPVVPGGNRKTSVNSSDEVTYAISLSERGTRLQSLLKVKLMAEVSSETNSSLTTLLVSKVETNSPS